MPFHRFEGLKAHRFNPHLSTAEGPVIEGEFMDSRMVTKRAGTGAELHYHPNELMAFPLRGKENVRYAAVRSTPRLEAAIRKLGAADNWRRRISRQSVRPPGCGVRV